MVRAAAVWAGVLLSALAGTAAEHRGVVRLGEVAVPGATVTVTDGAGKRVTAVTGADGSYAFRDLAGDGWTVRVEMQLFEAAERRVAAGEVVEWELQLKPLGELKVEKAAEFSRTEVAAVRQETGAPASGQRPVLPQEEAAELADRATDGLMVNGSVNNGASTAFAIAPAFGNFRRRPGSLYNASIGAVVGSSVLDARPFSLTGLDTPKPGYRRVTGLLAFGGPIRIPRLVRNGPNLMLNYQWTRNRDAVVQPGLVPTEAQRGGDLGAAGVIPASRISETARRLLELYPLPNFPFDSRYNYQATRTNATHQDSLQLRVNQPLSRRDQLFTNLSYQSTRTDNTTLFGFLDTTEAMGLNTAAEWRHGFTPRFSMTLGVQYSRMSGRVTPFFAGRRNVSGEAGIANNDQSPENWGPPAVSFASGISSLGDVNASRTRNQTTGFSVGSFWGRGRHNVSFGADVRRQQFNPVEQLEPRGSFVFTGAATGSDFSGFLLGTPDTASIAFGNADKYLRAWMNDAYFADDWRISPALTVNWGVRWEYGSPITERYGRLANLDFAKGFAAAAVVTPEERTGELSGRRYPRSLVEPDRLALQPRVGFAWRPREASSMVVRGGYGVYYNTGAYQQMALQMAQQPPFSRVVRAESTPVAPLTFANAFASGGARANTFAVDPDFQVGYSQNWQLTVQRDVPGALVVSATYAGNKGTRGVQATLPNTFPVGAADGCAGCARGYTYISSNGNSIRHAGQLQVRRRLRAGMSGSIDYTFAKSLDNATLGGRSGLGSLTAQNWADLGAERGRSAFDRRHAVTAQVQYTTSGRLGAWLREWTIASQVTAGSGLPLNPVYPFAIPGTGVTGVLRPDYTGAGLYDAPAGLFLNPAAVRAPAAGAWGNAGRNSINGPRQLVVNSSFGRTFRWGDRLNLDVRVDASNALNQVNYAGWNTVAGNAQFGFPTSANPMRTVQTVVRARF